MALVAVGGQGRQELAPQSDLDLLLLVGKGADGTASAVAEKLWYPIWDTGLKLGHAVRVRRATRSRWPPRTWRPPRRCCRSATWPATGRCPTSWPRRPRSTGARRGAGGWRSWPASVEIRHESAGEVAFELEPDLKEGWGGLRDVHALGWARAAGADVDARLLADLQRAPRHPVGGPHRAAPRRVQARRPAAAPGPGRGGDPAGRRGRRRPHGAGGSGRPHHRVGQRRELARDQAAA